MDNKNKRGPQGGTFGLILLLAVFLLITYAIGSGNNGLAAVCAVLFMVGSVVMYFMPAIIAGVFKHPSATGIGVLNFFLGWTVLGWVVALVWAFSLPKPAEVEATAEDEGMRACPYCAEPIRIQAIKCKHCSSDLSASHAT
jgi:hypothetical protein